MKTRLDCAAVARGLFPTRARAQAAIMAGKVAVNGKIAEKAGHGVKAEDKIEVLADPCPYVSRGGLKLKAAIAAFNITVKGRVCLDVGVATGGFTDCLLKEGALKVYSVDVGKGQIDDGIKKHPKVVFIPGTNARFLKPDLFDPLPSLAVIDVSFISLKLIIPPVINSIAGHADIIALIKPQFELERKQVPKGVVRLEKSRMEAINILRDFLFAHPHARLTPHSSPPAPHAIAESGLIPSPIKGAKGNIEYLWHLTKT